MSYWMWECKGKEKILPDFYFSNYLDGGNFY